MFEKLKEKFQEKKVYQPKERQECIVLFMEQSEDLMNHALFPAKAKSVLSSLNHQLSQIDIMKLSIDNQFKIERTITQEIPHAVDSYFSIPRAHAVSVVIKDGKTAKDIFIEKFEEFDKKLKNIIQDSIDEKTKKLMEKPKEYHAKKDFYDL